MPKTTFTYLSTNPYITLAPAAATVFTGFKQTLTATYGNVSGTPTITYRSSDTSVATVSGSGTTATVTGVAPGTATITASMTYQGTTYTATSAITVEDPSYCTPNPTSVDGKGITSLTFGSGDYVVNNSNSNGLPASSPYYGDYTSMVGSSEAGETVTVTITYSTGSSTVYSYGTIIWVDWNKNYEFEDSEIVFTGTSAQGSSGTPQVLNATFTVPATQAADDYRMRIAGADSYFDNYIGGSASANHSPCFSSTYAVCHDYTLRVNSASNCPAPTDLAVNNITPNSATVSWSGEAESYNVRYKELSTETLYDFEAGMPYGWTTIDADGDGFNWVLGSATDGVYTYGSNLSGYGYNSSTDLIVSGSYRNISDESGTALTPDNFLVSQEIELGGTISFYAHGSNSSYVSEHFGVFVSISSNNNPNDFVLVNEWTATTTSYTQYSANLSAYAGQRGYVAIRHFNCTDQFLLSIDNITITEPGGDWIIDGNVISPYTITGLNNGTNYEVQVQADCGTDGISGWSASETFTTPDACPVPTGLTATNVTNSSATISWSGNTDTYNIQYGAVDPDAPVTVILTADDVWGDGSGYQMLLDANATAYGTTIPTTGALTTSGDASAAVYAEFEYKIPVNADGSLTTTNIVSNGASVSIEIPAGTYDWCITNPTPGDRMWIASAQGNVGGRQDDYVFEPGKTYEFHVYLSGENDATDVTITNNAEMTVVNNVTSPYTLSNLDMDTQYEVQVQGVNCDGNGSTTEWSAGVSFTTLDGILVESIEADDVEVVVGGTANITNLVVLPADATNPAVTYTSNDETVATVDENGVVTGVAPGTTTITIAATDGSNVSTTINVSVTGIDVTGITAEDVEVVNGETATISYTVAPNNASDQSVIFTSADATIATVDTDGVVTGVAVGTTTITIASVSNPEVTATINVTVTSDPNTVQFTVNAPANAAPGDVITVEAVLNAPTEGTYNGFTGLVVGLHFDPTVFAVNGDPVKGPVAYAGNMAMYSLPNETHPETVNYSVTMTPGNPNTTTGIVYTAQFTVLTEAELGSYTFYVEPTAANQFVYNPGSGATPIPYEYVPSTVNITTVESYTKHIIGWNSEDGNGYNYYLIASPLAEDVDPSDVTNMIANTANEYDLYYFDQEGDNNGNEWINHKVVDFELENGKGYLYANKNSVDLFFTGAAPTDNEIKVPLEVKDCSNASGHFVGWNLVGNPFGVTAYIDRDCYKMNAAGSEIIAGSGNSVEAMEGIFVIATTNGEEMTFSKTNSGKGSKVVMNVSDSQGLADRAIVRFGEGSQLPKFQLFGNSTKVYFPEDDQDYAVVRSANENELPVNFKASSNGSYTMSVNVEELDMDYLHLIDNMTGMDVDLLQTPSYTFEATTSDEESRFRLVFATVDSVNENSFGFVNASGNLCIYGIEGKATVQVIDVLGHVLSSETFSGSYEKHLDVVPGVYMIRLIQGNDIRVQKMVVR